MSPSELYASLADVMKTPVEESKDPIGMLTTLERNRWAEAREELISISENERALQKVDGALFCVCLEDLASFDHKTVVSSLLHGDGSNR